MEFSRWASMIFGGLILLCIGIVTGMQIEAQRHRDRTAEAIPDRIVFEQAALAKPAPEKPAPAAKPAAKAAEPAPVTTTDEATTIDGASESLSLSAFVAALPELPPFPPKLPEPTVTLPAVAALPKPEPAPERVPEPAPAPAKMVPASVTSLPPANGGWRRNALAVPPSKGRAMVVVVIDDMGVDRKRSERIAALPGPLTTAFLPYSRDLRRQTVAAKASGHELMLHMPMEPQGESYDAGPNVLTVGLPAAELRRRLTEALASFDGMIGLNNHMGSRFTENVAGMQVVMEELRKRGLMFLDSVTSAKSIGFSEARRHGVASVARDVFLDNVETVEAVTAQLSKLEALAQKQGYAIAIGHPRDATIDALAAWLPTLKDRGVDLVPISTILRKQAAG